MVRVVVVEWPGSDCRLYRQPQWMAELRRDPSVTQFPRRHFDIGEENFERARLQWNLEEANSSIESALALLDRLGAEEIDPR